MATKQTSLRLGAETLEQLEYLSKLSGQSQAKVVSEVIASTVEWILEWADNHGMDPKANLLYRGGTILSVEEQRAVHQLRTQKSRTGATLWEDRKS